MVSKKLGARSFVAKRSEDNKKSESLIEQQKSHASVTFSVPEKKDEGSPSKFK